jgi:non-homologous end joining protein Ku
MAKWASSRSKVIELKKFVYENELTSWMIDKSDWLIPADGPLAKPYFTLGQSMWDEQVIGLGSASLYGKEHPIAVSATQGALMLHTLFAEDELVPGAEISAGGFEGVIAKEANLTREFIRLKKGHLESGDLVNKSRECQMVYIDALALGKIAEAPEQEPAPVPSLDYAVLVAEAIEKEKAHANV